MKKIYLSIISTMITGLLFAQDAHFSQPKLNTTMRNPAMTGLMFSQNKLTASYRSQWASIPSSFRTYGAFFEQKINKFSWGAVVSSSNAGAASLSQTNVQLKLSYQKSLAQSGHALRAGIAIGAIQQRFNPSEFSFDNQYESGTGLNSNLSTKENFDKTRQVLPDVTAGLVWLNKIGKISNKIGLSIAHLNQPAASFYTDGNEVYPIHTFFHLHSSLPVNDKWKANGLFQYSKQATAKEMIIGAGATYQIDKEKNWHFNIANRSGDAFILTTGIELKNSAFTISYDHQTSKLAGVTNGNGAIELSATFYFNQRKEIETPTLEKQVAIKNNPKNDSDGDGIPNGVDECPEIPGLWKYSGCNDKDGDGLYDSVDACPNLYGEKSNQGCPVNLLDSDLDGLVDDIDQCPFLKGLPEHKGCPDTDKDGISDKEDQCPFLKGDASNLGCPTRSIAANELADEEYMTTVHVEFDTDQAIIKPLYMERLNKVIATLQNKPSLMIYISGHTDTEGDAAYNYLLGEKRSLAVMDYFIQAGINNRRISIISYGEAKPVHTNNNIYGKARNRRAEVTLTKMNY